MVWIQTNPSRLKFTSLKIFSPDHETCVRLTTSILASPRRITSFYYLWKHLCGCVTGECESGEWSFLSSRSIRSWSPSFLQSADPGIFWCGKMSWLKCCAVCVLFRSHNLRKVGNKQEKPVLMFCHGVALSSIPLFTRQAHHLVP